MAFTKIAAAGIGSTGTVTLERIVVTGSIDTPAITGAASTANVRANSLVVSGVSTFGSVVATTGTFSGNVSIAGTLTYEDVTNIDSIGVVTARSGVRINSGGLVVTSGVSTLGTTSATNLSSQTLNVSGVSTFSSLQVGTVVTISSGIVTATSFSGSGASLTSIPNSALTNSTISGVSLGSNLNTLTLNTSGTGLSGSTTYNGSGASTFTVTSNATSSNTGSTIVARDASGNFSAGTITATLSGTATQVSNTLTLNTSGTGLSGSTTFNGSGASTFTVTSNATSANTANAIVARDASGNFSAGTITATLSGNATSATNSTTVGGLSVHAGRNNEANKIVRTQENGYLFTGYINSTNGDEGNNSSPARVWGTNGSDSYLRTYLTSALNSNNGAKTWVNFNGTNASIRASYNVSSVGRNGSGDYTINFASALPDANYATFIKGSRGSLNTSLSVVSRLNDNVTAPTSSAVRILYGVPDSSRNLQGEDSVYINVSIFR